MLHNIKRWARMLLRDVHAVYLAAYDPRVPWYAKILAAAVAGYALSPIDLIPDFIPVLGYADDLIIVPLGIWLVVTVFSIVPLIRWERFQDRDRAMSACAVATGVLSLPGAVACRCRAKGDLKWPGRLQRSPKFRWAWKSTCTPVRLANKRLRQLRISAEVDRRLQRYSLTGRRRATARATSEMFVPL
jgi:uncharacterized membrane protein YkvA (DUF1232 family)